MKQETTKHEDDDDKDDDGTDDDDDGTAMTTTTTTMTTMAQMTTTYNGTTLEGNDHEPRRKDVEAIDDQKCLFHFNYAMRADKRTWTHLPLTSVDVEPIYQ